MFFSRIYSKYSSKNSHENREKYHITDSKYICSAFKKFTPFDHSTRLNSPVSESSRTQQREGERLNLQKTLLQDCSVAFLRTHSFNSPIWKITIRRIIWENSEKPIDSYKYLPKATGQGITSEMENNRSCQSKNENEYLN